MLPFVLALSAGRVASEHNYNSLFLTRNWTVSSQCIKVPKNTITGSFVMPSLGQYEMGGTNVTAAFDAFGKLHKFELSPGQVCVTARMMATGFWNQSLQSGTIAPAQMFMDTSPPSPYSAVERLRGPNDNAFVNSYTLGGRFFSLTDSPFAVEFDLETMEVTNDVHWEDDLDAKALGLGSAHPLPELRDDGQRCTIHVRPQRDMTLKATHEVVLLRLCEGAPTTRVPIASVPTGEQFPYFHSFGLSQHYAVLPLQPLHMDMGSMLHGHPTVLKALQPYHPDRPMPIVVQPLDGSPPVRFELPGAAQYFVHVVNTFELQDAADGSTAVCIDLTLFGENYFATTGLDNMRNATARNSAPHSLRAQITRWKLFLDGPRAGEVAVTPLSDDKRATDFPQLHPARHGRPYCFYYAVEWFHDDRTNSRMAVVKQNVCTGKRSYWYREGVFPSEPTVVPRRSEGAEGAEGAEDDAVLLFTTLTGETGVSSLLVVDAATMETVSEVPMPKEAAMGFTVHGEFYS